MTLPLPRCALCGESLAHRPRLVIETASPGAPTLGWHVGDPNCARSDRLRCQYELQRESGRGDVLALVDGVLARGKERVRARKLFWKLRKERRR